MMRLPRHPTSHPDRRALLIQIVAVHYVFGLARNKRLEKRLSTAMREAEREARRTGKPARVFRDFRYSSLVSCIRGRRDIGIVELIHTKANPRDHATPLS